MNQFKGHTGPWPLTCALKIDFVTNRKRVCNFLPTTSLFHPNFGGVPLGLDCQCWVGKTLS